MPLMTPASCSTSRANSRAIAMDCFSPRERHLLRPFPDHFLYRYFRRRLSASCLSRSVTFPIQRLLGTLGGGRTFSQRPPLWWNLCTSNRPLLVLGGSPRPCTFLPPLWAEAGCDPRKHPRAGGGRSELGPGVLAESKIPVSLLGVAYPRATVQADRSDASAASCPHGVADRPQPPSNPGPSPRGST